MPKAFRQVLMALIGLGLLAAAWSLAARVSVEQANRVVAIAVDYNRVQELSGMSGAPVEAVLRRLKSAGATHLAVREDTLGDLLSEEVLRVEPSPGGYRLVPDPAVRDRVLAQLQDRLPNGKATPDGAYEVPSARTVDLLRPMGVGYSGEATRQAAAARLRIVARPVAEMAITPRAVSGSVESARAVGADVVIFAGIQVLGVFDLVKLAAEELQRSGVAFGYLEMAKQFGEDKLGAALRGNYIRCHAVAAEEMIKLPAARAIDRYALAVRERNVRLCYVRPYSLSGSDPVQSAADYVGSITQSIVKAGFRTGVPEFFRPVAVPKPALAVMLMAVGACLIWLLQTIFGLPARRFQALVIADVVLSILATFGLFGLAQSVGALAATALFPTLALLSVQLRDPGGRPSLLPALRAFAVISLISLIGGLLAAGCISDRVHMLQLAAFRGVKLAQLIPIFLVMGFFVTRCTRSYQDVRTETGGDSPEWPALRAGAAEAALAAVKYWHVGLILVGMAAGAVMLMRSGNVTPMPPSDMELKVRDALETALVVRPRTKEIFLGHPALLLSLAFILAGWRRGAWVGMLLGTVGQVSLVNTFGHIHTPLMVSAIRAFNGLWLGVVVALLAWAVGSVVARGWRVCQARRSP